MKGGVLVGVALGLVVGALTLTLFSGVWAVLVLLVELVVVRWAWSRVGRRRHWS